MACIAVIPIQALECVESWGVHRRLPSFLAHHFSDMFPHGVFYRPIEYLGPVQKKESFDHWRNDVYNISVKSTRRCQIDASDKEER